MLVITTHNFFLFTRKEIWFYNGEEINEGTYNVFSAAKKKYGTGHVFYEKYETSIIDLHKPEPELFNAIHTTFRYDIRVAEKQGIHTALYFNPNKKDCHKLINDFNLFANEKKLSKMNVKWVMALQKKGSIC